MNSAFSCPGEFAVLHMLAFKIPEGNYPSPMSFHPFRVKWLTISKESYQVLSSILFIVFSHHVWHFATPWTVAFQAPLFMRFPRQEYCSGLPFAPPGDLPNPGTEPASLVLAGRFLPLSHQGSPLIYIVSSLSVPY